MVKRKKGQREKKWSTKYYIENKRLSYLYHEIMIGTTSSGISYQLIEINTSYAGAAGEMLHINGIFTMRTLK